MRKILITSTAALSLAATAAGAGGMAEPITEPEVIVEDTAGTSGDFIVPLLLLVLVAAAVSSGGNGGPVAPSDIRLKTDIRPTGATADGLPIYRFRYTGLPGTYEGVMAQDVLARHPEAVVTLPFGYLGVDYGMLGLEMRRID